MRVERELRIWCQQYCFQHLFVDGELDVFIDDQKSSWHGGAVANPLQIEFAEPWEEFGDEIGLHYCVGHEPRYWLYGSLERYCHKPCWLLMRLSDPQERLSYLLCQKAYVLLFEKSLKRLESESHLRL